MVGTSVTRKVFAVLVGWMLCATLAPAADIEGVRVEDRITLPGGPPLVLNGAGVRTKLGFVKLYVGALHLQARNKSAEEILKDGGAKRVSMFVLADEITAKELVASLNNALAANHIPMEMALIEARLRQLNEMMISTGALKKGAVVTLSYVPATGTHIRINSEEKLVIKGEDFFRAMLRIWIGNKPVDGRLRDAMLGDAGGLRLF
jgi:Chalcone isomerase-like